MNKKYIIGLDQSTSGTKVVLVNGEGHIDYKKTMEHNQYYPRPGWVEHNPNEIYTNCVTLVKGLLEDNKAIHNDIAGLSITNQRETVVLWDSVTKEPLCNAIVWQCRRGALICEALKEQGYSDMIVEKTGLQLDPYFSASKIKWAIENNENVAKSLKANTLCLGTVDAWLIYKLTDGQIFATDHSNASRTMLYNISTNDWDDEILALFGLERSMLPEIKSSNHIFGQTQMTTLGMVLPICGVIGDSQGALFGQQCFELGSAKATYGTGSSLLMYVGNKKIRSDNGILSTVAWCLDGEVAYALEGVINSSGDTLKWVKDNLGLYTEDDEVEQLTKSIESTEGVYIIPALVGLGAPYWKPMATASIVGLTRQSNRAHIVRAAVESMAYQVADLMVLMEEESGITLSVLNVDGGPTQNEFLMQLQADLLQTHIQTAKYQELSVLGAVYLGFLGLGVVSNREELKSLKTNDRIYHHQMSSDEANEKLKQWQEVIIKHS